jgi:outer membrane lipoprotein-sorting protein
MDGMLWNWKEKGYTVTFDGKEDMEGTSCYKIKLDTKEGDSFTYYIDADSYIMLRTNTKMKRVGNEIESDTYYSNYMTVEGIAVPAKIETKMKDQLMATLVIEKVEFNTDIDDTLFEKPAK